MTWLRAILSFVPLIIDEIRYALARRRAKRAKPVKFRDREPIAIRGKDDSRGRNRTDH